MKRGLEATYQLLKKTENRAAIDILLSGVKSRDQKVRNRSILSLLSRTEIEGHRAVFSLLGELDETAVEIVSQKSDKLIAVAGEKLLLDNKNCELACKQLIAFKVYAAIPMLVKSLDKVDPTRGEIIAATIRDLTGMYYAEFSGTATTTLNRKDRDSLRIKVTVALEEGTKRFHRHQQEDVIESFLMIVRANDAILRQLLQQVESQSNAVIIEMLKKSEQGGVIRLLLGFLDDTQMPRVAVEIISGRSDKKFLESMFKMVVERPGKNLAPVLRQFTHFDWAEVDSPSLKEIDALAQAGAARLLMMTAIDEAKRLELIGWMLLHGKPEGRREAAEALGQFDPTPSVYEYIHRGLHDKDSRVRANLIPILRSMKVPNAYSLLVHMVNDNLDEVIRESLVKAMPEFVFKQYLQNFDKMPEQLQAVIGNIVQRIDLSIHDGLRRELKSRSPVHRRRATQIAATVGLVSSLQEEIVELLSDDDHMVRVAAAQVLGECKTRPSWKALREAMFDRSVAVKEAAEKSLDMICGAILKSQEEQDTNTAPGETPAMA